jgi:hypothetical protein
LEATDMPTAKETTSALKPKRGDIRAKALALLLAIAEINEEKDDLRKELIALSKNLGLRLGVIRARSEIGALIRAGGTPVLWADLEPDGPDGEAFVDLGSPPDPRMVRLINIVIGAPEEALGGGEGDDRIFRWAHDGVLRFGFGVGVDLFPGDVRGVELHGAIRLSLSSSAGCWFIEGEGAA